jgi:hypothetical protein
MNPLCPFHTFMIASVSRQMALLKKNPKKKEKYFEIFYNYSRRMSDLWPEFSFAFSTWIKGIQDHICFLHSITTEENSEEISTRIKLLEEMAAVAKQKESVSLDFPALGKFCSVSNPIVKMLGTTGFEEKPENSETM